MVPETLSLTAEEVEAHVARGPESLRGDRG